MARHRKLRPEEIDLWRAVARTARPMRGATPADLAATDPVLPETAPVQGPDPLPRFRLGEKAPVFRRDESLPSPALRMDAKAFARLTKGKLAPEARIDLHGMTVAQAHPELVHFLMNAHAHGLRLVLVITGKGKAGPDFGPIPQRYGVLKHQVPNWLRTPPLAGLILQVTDAHLKHGGTGALYVYLRRARG